MSPRERALPAPGVVFSADYLRRVDALFVRLSAARELREGAGAASILGQGEEFAGYRPYRPGEDLRQLDWNLYARLDKPFVRVTRREAGEVWAVLVDASASMGVGPPGKLQRAAECAVALASLGLCFGARVKLFISSDVDTPARQLGLRTREESAAAVELFSGLQASGSGGLAQLVATPRSFAECGRVFLIGDLFDLEPSDVLKLRRGGRDLAALQLLAPAELEPREGARRWWNPESGEELELEVDARLLASYEARLDSLLEGWRRLSSAHAVRYACRGTTLEFEDLTRELVGV